MIRIHTLVIAATLLLICSSLGFAQRDPSLISSRHYAGIEAGINYGWLGGGENFFWVYNYPVDPLFPNTRYIAALRFQNLGGGIGYHFGGTIDFSLSDFIGLQGKVFYRSNSTSSTEQFTDSCAGINGGAAGLATFENNYKFKATYVGVDIGVRFQFVPEGLYGLLGLEYASNSSATLSGYTNIINSTNGCQWLSYPTGTQIGTNLPIAEGDITSSMNSSQLLLKVGAGTFIPIGNNGWVLTPELNLGIPLSSLFSQSTEDAYKNGVLVGDPAVVQPSYPTATTPKLWYASLSVALKFPFGARSRDEMSGNEPADVTSTPNEKTVDLSGRVTDANTGEPVRANVTVTDLKDSKVVATTKTDGDGRYKVKVKYPGKYSVTADADGYLFGSTYYEVDDQGRILKGDHDIKLSNANNGRTRLLIFFDFGKDNLQPESYPELERAVSIMKAHPSMEVEIAGYTDNVGGDQVNKDLSLRRAKAVRDYLIRHGIDANRITAKGYGKDNPILPNDTDEGRAANRRVEFVVLKK